MRRHKLNKMMMEHSSKMYLLNLQSGQREEFQGYLQPLRYKNKMYLGQVATELGYDNSAKSLLLTLPQVQIKKADGYKFAIEFDGQRFCCDRFELEYFEDEPLYAWSIVTRIKNAEQ